MQPVFKNSIHTMNNTPPQKNGDIIDINQLCVYLDIGKNTAYRLLNSGEINGFKIGSVWKIPMESVDAYIARMRRKAKLVPLYTVLMPDRDLYFERYGEIPIMRKSI